MPPPIDLAPLAGVALFGSLLAAAPLAWLWLRRPDAAPLLRLRALTSLALFLTFDLVLVGAYTRLSDSGLGCPDWPGCYGSTSPLGAHSEIAAAQSALPSGAVTHEKAWTEMAHRYLASAVGVVILVLTLASWLQRGARRRSDPSPWWPTLTLLWVCLQGAFGALTVTLQLYPAIVTAHLLGGLGLLALLAALAQAQLRAPLAVPAALARGVALIALLCAVQIALGGWVSTNYAVLACSDFPTCQGSWWPPMDFAAGFALRRELGASAAGGWLPFSALTAIHYSHRLMAYAVLLALGLLAWRLYLASASEPALRAWSGAFALVAIWQLASGLANVTLGWPLAAALAHTGGAAMLVVLLSMLLVRTSQARGGAAAKSPFVAAARVAS